MPGVRLVTRELYPADPPTVEERVCVMRHASEDPHGFRLRAMIVMLLGEWWPRARR
jgi:hypothetical protein